MSEATSEKVRLERLTESVAQIVIDRPERHNAMSIPMYETLLALIDQCRADETVGCIVLRGAGGKSFISGTDIDYFRDFTAGSQGVEYEALVEQVIDAVERIAVPTVAAIDGWAVGGGLAIATACDFRICAQGSRFGAPIAKTLSNTLSSRNLARLVAAFGVPRVKKMLLLSDFLSAAEAHACGYVYDVTAKEQVGHAACALAERLVALSPVTQHAVKESLRRIVIDQSLADEDLVEQVYGSQRFRDAVAAFGSGTPKG
ncbi:enoyl-CoA hydratase [Paraburkholderia tuberum]|uniref:Enoyl-CoA hydratase/carnithine racemase n=1 Tax=Paraburkholderia tuberum TaxID=157910 RepID=A0A1H1JNK4_9BURK|nr:enoyl-CoA hydratase [Paraburkholderia tuberum]SDR51522.1 Enoyl-CoA hydratase/carnithine racemase [Paraburkholderia tuberum]